MINKTLYKSTLIGILALAVVGCNSDNAEVTYIDSVSFDLAETNGEWQAGFADYPVGGEDEWELTATENVEFTLASGETVTGYFLHSSNRSDDTQMYISRKIEGLMPSTHYEVSFDIQLATNVNDMCMGIGGAPHSVTVKAGLTTQALETTVDSIDHYRLNIDTGSQTNGGLDAQSLGNIGLDTLEDCDPASTVYGLKEFDNADNLFEVTSDENGELWLTLLTDSGFEGPSSLYFTRANVTFTQSEKSAEGFSVDLDFSQSQPSITTVFYDYPIGREFEWELTSEPQQTVDLEQGGTVTGHLLYSYNRSDDTGMLLHTPIKGLAANTSYTAVFKATIATNVNNMCFGIGGAPHSVYVKTGLSVEEPRAIMVENDNHYRINIDLGNNMAEGVNGLTLGDIGSETLLDCDPGSNLFGPKAFDSQALEKTLTITTDDRGVLYFSLATDSGFEGPTTILFTDASVTFERAE